MLIYKDARKHEHDATIQNTAVYICNQCCDKKIINNE